MIKRLTISALCFLATCVLAGQLGFETNQFQVDGNGIISLKSVGTIGDLAGSNAATVKVNYATNAATSVQALTVADGTYFSLADYVRPNFAYHYWIFSTNESFQFLAPTNVITAGGKVQWIQIMVTNTAGSVKDIYRPDESVFTNGVWNVTNASLVEFWNWAGLKTNAICTPIN